MTDATTAAAPAAAATTTPSAAATLTGAPAASVAAAGGAPPPVAGGATGAAPPAAGDWLGGADADSRAYAQKKGWQTPADLLLSYRNLEKLTGNDKLFKPKGKDDVEGYNQLYNALGRPEKPEGYKLPVPDGQSDAFAKSAAPVLHKLGITQDQAAGLAEWWNGQAKGVVDADTKAKAEQVELDVTSLRTEWGGQFDANVESGRRAARAFGLDAEAIGKIESGLGTAATYKLMAKIGLALGEDPCVPSDTGGTGFANTKERAVHEISTLKLDKDFMAAYLDPRSPGHKDAMAKMSRLHQVAAG